MWCFFLNASLQIRYNNMVSKKQLSQFIRGVFEKYPEKVFLFLCQKGYSNFISYEATLNKSEYDCVLQYIKKFKTLKIMLL